MGQLEKAKTPVKEDSRERVLIYGVPASGKSTMVAQLPNSIIVDPEHSMDNYYATIKAKNSKVLKTNSFEDLMQLIKELRTTKHEYRNLVIEAITLFNQDAKEVWTEKFRIADKKNNSLEDFGPRFWNKFKGSWNLMYRELHKLDMNVWITAHEKKNFDTPGSTFDSDSKIDGHAMETIFRIEKRGKDRVVTTEKQRVDEGQKALPNEFLIPDGQRDALYKMILSVKGSDAFERESTPVKLASDEQLVEIKRLLELFKPDEELLRKWFKKADVEGFSEMTDKQIDGCINFFKKQLDTHKQVVQQ